MADRSNEGEGGSLDRKEIARVRERIKRFLAE